MSLEALKCPACAASVSIAPGAGQTTCSYCGTALRIQRTGGEQTLILAEQVNSAIAAVGAQTHAAIGENTAVTREELRRMQLSHEIASLEMRLTTVQSEIRGLQRMPPSPVAEQQLRDLQKQEAALLARIGEVQGILDPPAPDVAVPPIQDQGGKKKQAKTPKQAAVEGKAKQRGCVGWTLLVLAWFFFWPFMLPWTMIRSRSKPVRIIGWIVAALFAFYFLLALLAPSSQPAPAPTDGADAAVLELIEGVWQIAVHPQGAGQVTADLSQHLVWFAYLDRGTGSVEAQRLAQFVDHADVHACHEAAAEVQRHAV